MTNWPRVFELFGQHIWLAVTPTLLGLLLAIPLGWLAQHYRWLYPAMIGGTGLLYTIPSLALFIALPAVLGTGILDPLNVIVALTLYTLALLVRTVADGLAAVPLDVRQAATAMGFRPLRRFFTVELPVAVPSIAAGLRVASVSNVAMVTIAATIGVQQLGMLFTDGFGSGDLAPVGIGLVACLLLALALDGLIVGAGRVLTPWQRAVRAR
ncbi:MAG TPA: ABC transporter permease subunit [Actinopolymorphaceae bacterium]